MKAKTNIKFSKAMYIAFIVSIAVAVVFIVAVAVKGANNDINVGIDFQGGWEVKVKIDSEKDLEDSDIREIIQDGINVQKIIDMEDGSASRFVLRMKGGDKDENPAVDTLNAIRDEYGYEARLSYKAALPITNEENQIFALLPEGASAEKVSDKEYELSFTEDAFDTMSYSETMGMIRRTFEDKYGKLSAEVEPTVKAESSREIAGVISSDNMAQAFVLIVISWMLILAYISMRFELRYAVAAITALVHDVIITLGIVILAGIELDVLILSAVLTLIGYSVNDTIVLFDRVRENTELKSVRSFKEILDISINQTLTRTMNTSVSTLLAVLAMFFIGGDVIEGFSFTLIIGLLVGTYSSVFIASTMALIFGGNDVPVKKEEA